MKFGGLVAAIAGAMLIAGVAQGQQAQVYKARLEPDAKNVGMCMELDTALRREHTLNVNGATAMLTGSGGVKATLKQTAAKTYENSTVQIGANQFKVVASLAKSPSTLVITDNRLGCRWSGNLGK